jgi:hypothetical protein
MLWLEPLIIAIINSRNLLLIIWHLCLSKAISKLEVLSGWTKVMLSVI